MLKNALKTGPRCSLTCSLDEGVVRGKLVLNLFVPLRPGRWADATAMQLLLAYYYIIGGLQLMRPLETAGRGTTRTEESSVYLPMH